MKSKETCSIDRCYSPAKKFDSSTLEIAKIDFLPNAKAPLYSADQECNCMLKNIPFGVNFFYIVEQFEHAIGGAALIARHNNMARAFAIAPTASCSYKSKDVKGFTCTPEIAPPIAKSVDRDSGTFGVERVSYGDVEIASEVGWDVYKRVTDGIVKLLDATGLLHGYSFNSWSDVVTYDNAFVEEWLESPQTSLYYSLQVMGDTQDKTNAYAALDQDEVDDYLKDILNNPINCDCQE